MTPVTPPTYMKQSQANINEFLKSFFDGAAHAVGDQSYTFPLCDIKFGRQQLPLNIVNPWIVVESVGPGNPDQVWAGSKAMKIRRDGQWRFIVITQGVNQPNASNWKTNDSITDLLGTILNACRSSFAPGGMKIITVGQAVKTPDPSIQFATINVTIRADMSQHNN